MIEYLGLGTRDNFDHINPEFLTLGYVRSSQVVHKIKLKKLKRSSFGKNF
jgi:hypothetical protein